MRRFPVRQQGNFYDDDDSGRAAAPPAARSAAALVTPQSSAVPHRRALDEAPTPPRSAAVPAPQRDEAVGHLSGRRSSSSSSSASIEHVMRCDATPPPPTLRSTAARDSRVYGEYVSLRQLHESVEEGVRDVRRIDALTRKAVWHALTQQADVPPRGLGDMARSDPGPAMHSSATTLLHDRPFLPPDRFPTTPPLHETPDHFARNLSRALFAAQRAGLLERQRVWMQQHQHSADGRPTATASSAAAPSARRTALQRISSLAASGADGSRAGKHQLVRTGRRAGETAQAVAGEEEEEERVRSSVSLIVLRVAKDRAIAAVFLRQLRLNVYQRHVLHEGVELRCGYYIQRRVLRAWCAAAALQRHRRVYLLSRVVAHWQGVVRRRRALRAIVVGWRQQLRQRSGAFVACLCTRRRRCWRQWRRALTWHRERSALYEVADQLAESRRRRLRDTWWTAGEDGGAAGPAVLALLQGRPHALGGGALVVTAVGSRLALRRLFVVWRRRTERRLMTQLAAWHDTQSTRVRVVRRLCRCARLVALKHHRRRHATEEPPRHTSSEAYGGEAGSRVAEGEPRVPPRVWVVAVSGQVELLRYKESVACSLARGARLRRCFGRWRTRRDSRAADRFHLRCVYATALCRWLCALAGRRAQRQLVELALSRWVSAVVQRQRVAQAAQHHMRCLVRCALHCWRDGAAARRAHRSCVVERSFGHWWERAMLRRARRVLECALLRAAVRRWHARLQTRLHWQTHFLIAATIRETALALGSVRWWRMRAAERRRTRLAWEVLAQLRRERVSRRCFDVWCRRTFGPAAPWPVAQHQGSAARSSAPLSLLA
ncbi:hypothetical protein NESM_000752600 [Novymonas esmeraldas]|uniref:Uncharacterized protein n=1 Tax=Novymonas esmeraldas TaxID=1808958 RepID=A0AAW0EWS8_9TRYP